MPLSCHSAVKRHGSMTRPKVIDSTEMVVLIDKSGSMQKFSSKVILKSINQLINNHKKISPNTIISVIAFNDQITQLVTRVMIDDMSDIVKEDIKPENTTALYDGVSSGLDILDDSSMSSKILLVITDGLENSSINSSHTHICTKIADSLRKGFLVKFLGGGQDAIAIGLGLGIGEECCLSFSNDDYGIDGAMESATRSLERHALGECHSFTPIERATSLSVPLPYIPGNCNVLGRISTLM